MQKKISEIKKELQAVPLPNLKQSMEQYQSEERHGVIELMQQMTKKIQKYEAELLRLENMKVYEQRYSEYETICGIDEAGRGPLAGPVVAAAVILPKQCEILYLNDSKKVPEKKREELYYEILEKAVAVGVGVVSHQTIDEINILEATYCAMREAISKLSVVPTLLLNDAVRIPGILQEQIPIVHGDAKSVSIAAASIIAKVTRDRIMREYDQSYPGYDFASNKGYGSEKHILALKRLGSTPIHRKLFIRKFV